MKLIIFACLIAVAAAGFIPSAPVAYSAPLAYSRVYPRSYSRYYTPPLAYRSSVFGYPYSAPLAYRGYAPVAYSDYYPLIRPSIIYRAPAPAFA